MGQTGVAAHQKKASRLNAALIFLDESSFMMAPLVRRSWVPRDVKPLLYQRGRSHQKVSAIAALCVPPGRNRVDCYFRLHPNANVDAAVVVSFLRQLATLFLCVCERTCSMQELLDEHAFRFNRRAARACGLLFYRLMEQAMQAAPVTYDGIVGGDD